MPRSEKSVNKHGSVLRRRTDFAAVLSVLFRCTAHSIGGFFTFRDGRYRSRPPSHRHPRPLDNETASPKPSSAMRNLGVIGLYRVVLRMALPTHAGVNSLSAAVRVHTHAPTSSPPSAGWVKTDTTAPFVASAARGFRSASLPGVLVRKCVVIKGKCWFGIMELRGIVAGAG